MAPVARSGARHARRRAAGWAAGRTARARSGRANLSLSGATGPRGFAARACSSAARLLRGRR
eukprot:4954136-Lingulodinium_polyedra.AAC.1